MKTGMDKAQQHACMQSSFLIIIIIIIIIISVILIVGSPYVYILSSFVFIEFELLYFLSLIPLFPSVPALIKFYFFLTLKYTMIPIAAISIKIIPYMINLFCKNLLAIELSTFLDFVMLSSAPCKVSLA